MNGREDSLYYPRLVAIHGEYCYLCTLTPHELGVEKLEIHEIKYQRPLKIDNMRLLCHGCNNLKVLNKENVEGSTESAPAVYRVSRTRHPAFLEFVSKKMMLRLNQGLEYTPLVADACLYTGMRRQTIINWLRPLWEGENSPYVLWGDVLYLRGKEPRGKLEDLPTRDKELTDTEREEMK